MKRNRWVFLVLLFIALAVRSLGLFHGLGSGVSFHPDASKQVNAAMNYLHGTYVWYQGSLAYDGYPYGLNHVDEWLLRGVWPLARGVVSALGPGFELDSIPSKTDLHYILRALRVIYSLVAWGLFAWILGRFSLSRAQYGLWLLLGAIAPISSIVTHAATGDVGPDLFVMIALALLVHARSGPPRMALFAACGFALGCAFACKYHGILAGLAPGLFLLLAPLSWRRRLQLGVAVGLGAIAGFIALTPHVLIAPKKTLKLIVANFGYIKNYGVDPAFFDLPVWTRWTTSWQNNVPLVVDALGAVAFVLAIIALLLAIRRFSSGRSAERAWDLALIATPFISIAAALSGKPQLQPFHFSFFALPILLAGALIPSMNRGRFLQIALPALLLLGVFEFAAKQQYDGYFWLRNDTLGIVTRMENDLVLPDTTQRSAVVAQLAIENDNRAVFRNRPQRLKLTGAADWISHPDELLPSTPWPFSDDWIFTSIPAFPRESRLLPIPRDERTERGVITKVEEDLPITIYSATRRAEVLVLSDRQTHHLELDPFESRQIVIPADDGKYFTSRTDAWRRHHIQITSKVAPVLVRFGAEPTLTPPPQRNERKLEQAYFLNGVWPIEGGTLLRNRCLTPGIYAMEVNAPENSAPMTLIITDALIQNEQRSLNFPLEWTNGAWRVEWQQPRDLLFVNIGLSRAGESNLWPVVWHIRPLKGLPMTEEEVRDREWSPQVSFDRGNWTLGNIAIPERIEHGAHFSVHVQMDCSSRAAREMRGYTAFLHLLDENGRQVYQYNLPLIEMPPARSGLSLAQHLGTMDLPPGRYEARIGIYTPRTGHRLKPDTPNTSRDRRVPLGFITVE